MFGKNSKVDAVASSVMQVIEKVTTDTTKGREAGSINSFTPAKVTLKGDVEKKPDPKEPQETTARKSIEAKGVKSEETVQEVSPPGWSGTVKVMKKHKNISNPFALAWSMKNKGAKSHIKAEETEIVDESVIGALKAGVKKGLEKLGGGTDKDQLQRLRDNMYGKQKNPSVKEESETVEEALKGGQKKIDKNHNGKIDAQDFKILRGQKNEEVEHLDEGKMDAMSLSHLWHAHAKHTYWADQGYGEGSNSPKHAQHAATAIENHVRKHHGNKVADDMVSHSDHHVAHAEYVGGKEAKEVEHDAAKLRAKHKIKGDLYGNHESVNEGWDDMLKSVADSKKPQPNGGSGVKKGKSYGNQKPEKDEKEKDVKEGYEDSAEDKAEDKKEAKKRHMSMKDWEKSAADKKQDMKEAKTLSPGQDDAPFEPPYKDKPATVTDKSGAKHTPMSRAKNLARAAMDKIKKDHKLG